MFTGDRKIAAPLESRGCVRAGGHETAARAAEIAPNFSSRNESDRASPSGNCRRAKRCDK